ncbi:OmpH family outer membrane protein [Derxia gummosa]|uniref:OmpH family outer membrane protein n=1 Tax=Derxia gummosa DSM 723 TaxID=1121388 RepID=A0A8B6X3Q3_9BURK|nr:OmpH family outer membrane protein [Derxia gummosa]
MFLTRTISTQLAGVAAGILLSLPAVASADEPLKVGFVSTERVMRDSAPAKAAQQRLEADFAKRQKELEDMAARLKAASDKLDKDAAILTDSDRARRQKDLADQDRDFQRRQRELREDLNQRRNEEITALLDRANKVIKQIAESEKYDLILQESVYFSPRIDITDKVLKQLNQQGAK